MPFLVFVGALGVCGVFALSRQVRPLGFALCLAALLIGGHKEWGSDDTIWSGRSYFGVYRIVETAEPPTRSLIHARSIPRP